MERRMWFNFQSFKREFFCKWKVNKTNWLQGQRVLERRSVCRQLNSRLVLGLYSVLIN